jgi:glycosyltransferase involved in cell wall biosynthesis
MDVAVIIPAYNSASTVGAAIDSALDQGGEGIEFTVVDDGSNDSTAQVLEKYAGLVKVIRQHNSGAAAARNAGVAATSGQFLAFLDADDVWLPDRLQRTVSALQSNPEAVMAFCDYLSLDESGRILERSFAGSAPSHEDLLMRTWPILPSAVTIKRWAFERVGGFSQEFRGCGAEDHYLWMLLSEYGTLEYVQDALMLHRQSPPGVTAEKYADGGQVFARLVKARYGARAANLLRESQSYLSGMLLAAAIAEVDAGDVRGGLRQLYGALRYQPFLLFHPRMLARVLRIRNLRRVVDSLGQMLGQDAGNSR